MKIILTIVCCFAFNAAVGAMAPPLPAQQRTFYGWLYRALQRFAANVDRLEAARFGIHADADPITGEQLAALVDPAHPGAAIAVTHERDTIMAVASDL